MDILQVGKLIREQFSEYERCQLVDFNFAENKIMFGLDKLKQVQKKAAEMKERLSAIIVEGRSSDGKVTVEANGNRDILSVDIDRAILHVREKEVIDRLVLEAIQDAMQKAQDASESQIKGMMPNIPGLG